MDRVLDRWIEAQPASQWISSSSFHFSNHGTRRMMSTEGWLEPRTIVRVLDLDKVFVEELKLVLDLDEVFVGELKLVLKLVKGFLEELKLVLVE
jgi:hypothetical protein